MCHKRLIFYLARACPHKAKWGWPSAAWVSLFWGGRSHELCPAGALCWGRQMRSLQMGVAVCCSHPCFLEHWGWSGGLLTALCVGGLGVGWDAAKESIGYKTCVKDTFSWCKLVEKAGAPMYWILWLPLPPVVCMEGVESKTLALLTHLGKPFSCFDFLAAIEHPMLKYHRASDAGCSVCWGPWGMPGARGARGERSSVLFWGWCPIAMNGSVLFWQSLSARKRYGAFENVSQESFLQIFLG